MKFNIYIILFALLVVSFTISYFIFPKIINIAHLKGLYANTNKRSSHNNQIPNIGGVVFILVMAFAIYISQEWDYSVVGLSVLFGLLILFFIGIKDDFMVVSIFTKIGAQMIAIFFVLIHPAFQIETLNGFLGIDNVPLWFTLPLSALLMLVIINAFNLIDGIDGLAAMIGILIFGFLASLFFVMNLYFFVILSVISIGSLAAFLRYNLSAKKKIFMGDSGSLIIGFAIAAAVVRIFAIPSSNLQTLPFMTENLHIIVFAVLLVPFFDTARVFTIRLLNKKNPFKPDRNHIHHVLIDNLQISHKAASSVLVTANLLVALLFVFFGKTTSSMLLLAAFVILILLLSIIFYLIKKTRSLVYEAD